MLFEFATATRVIFGGGVLSQAGEVVRGAGLGRLLLVTGRNTERAERLRAELRAVNVDWIELAVSAEPTVELARAGVARVLSERCDGVLAFGGGSALDAGKAIAALAANGGDPLDYLEVIGRGLPLERPSLPFVAIPTTAGTGSEVTRNAVLLSREQQVKVSLRSPHLAPRVAIIDPDLLVGAPASVLVASGLDALSQLVEPFISCRANPVTDGLAREGIRRSVRSLRRAVLEGADPQAREDLALASLLGGLCLANAGLGAVHGFAAPAGGMFAAPHGAVCAALLAPAMAVNLQALATRAPEHPSVARFGELAGLFTDRTHPNAAETITWLESLSRDLGVVGLGGYGMTAADIPALVAKARLASSMKGNPIVLSDEELTEIAVRAL